MGKSQIPFVILVIIILVSTIFAFPCQSFAWGAVTVPLIFPVSINFSGPVNTHQFILQKAYDRLLDDPAVKIDSFFPNPNDMLKYEGVEFRGAVRSILWGPKGAGPDADDQSNYSQHYYNPYFEPSDVVNDTVGRGNAPESVAKYFGYLVMGMDPTNFSKDRVPEAQAACWSAHFLADMHLPHHTVGISMKEFQKRWEDVPDPPTNVPMRERKDKIIELSDAEIGPSALWWGSDLSRKDSYFEWMRKDQMALDLAAATRLYNEYAGGSEKRDWFDPYYYHDIPDMPVWNLIIVSSSHVAWEQLAHTKLRESLGNKKTGADAYKGYSSDWKNPVPSFDTYLTDHMEKMEIFAANAAKETRDGYMNYLLDPLIGINRAIQRITTMWRASVTALKPDVQVAVPDEKKPDRLKVTGFVKNIADEPAKQIVMRLTVWGGSIQGNPEQPAKMDAGINGGTASVIWDVKSSDPKNCMVKLEVIGHYENTPDLQYAMLPQRPIQIKTQPATSETTYDLTSYTKCIIRINTYNTYRASTGATNGRDEEVPPYKDAVAIGSFDGNKFHGSLTTSQNVNFNMQCVIDVEPKDASKVRYFDLTINESSADGSYRFTVAGHDINRMTLEQALAEVQAQKPPDMKPQQWEKMKNDMVSNLKSSLMFIASGSDVCSKIDVYEFEGGWTGKSRFAGSNAEIIGPPGCNQTSYITIIFN